MSTTVHLPPDLLESVDHRSRELGMSRNRYVIRALERALETETRWTARFVEEIERARSDDEGRQALEELVTVIAANRSRKAPPEL
jgi:predicted transcriptional regulator